MYPLQVFLEIVQSHFTLTVLVQLTVVSTAGFIAVKAVSRQSAPLRSLIALSVMLLLALTLVLSFSFRCSNISWCGAGFVKKHMQYEIPSESVNIAVSESAYGKPVEPGADLRPVAQSGFDYDKIIGIIKIIWLSGTLFMLLRLVYGAGLLELFKYKLIPLRDRRFNRLLSEAADFLNFEKVPPLYCSSQIKSPVSTGIVRSAIVIPDKLLDGLNDDEVKSILLHELAHILHRDHFTGIVKRIIIAANWWNPLVYIISAEHSAVREEIADNYVLLKLCPKVYSECLAGLAEKVCLINNLPATTGMAGKHSNLEKRVKKILSKNRKLTMKTGKAIKLTALINCGILAILIAGMQAMAEPGTSSDSAPVTGKIITDGEKTQKGPFVLIKSVVREVQYQEVSSQGENKHPLGFGNDPFKNELDNTTKSFGATEKTSKSFGVAEKTSTIICTPKVITNPGSIATVKLVSRKNVRWEKNESVDLGVILQLKPTLIDGKIRLQGKLSITTLADQDVQGKKHDSAWLYTNSTDARFSTLVEPDTPTELPPVKYNGKILKITLEACLIDKNGKKLITGKGNQ